MTHRALTPAVATSDTSAERGIRIGELAARSGTSRDTIRYYERFGLLGKAPRTAGGYRIYSEQSLNRLRVIRNARRFGFSLEEILGFMKVREAGHAPCRQVHAAAEERLRGVEAQIQDLMALRDAMKETLARWEQVLDQTPEGRPARLLEGDLSPLGEPAVSLRRK